MELQFNSFDMSGLGSYDSLCPKKRMRKLNKGDFTLDTMSVEEFCIQGGVLELVHFPTECINGCLNKYPRDKIPFHIW